MFEILAIVMSKSRAKKIAWRCPRASHHRNVTNRIYGGTYQWGFCREGIQGTLPGRTQYLSGMHPTHLGMCQLPLLFV